MLKMRGRLEKSSGAMRWRGWMFWIEGDVDIEADTVLCGYWLVFCAMMVMIDVVTRMIHI